MLTAEQVEQYRRSGFVNGGPVLSEAEVAVLQDEVLRVIDDRDNLDAAQPVELRNLVGDDAHPIWQIINIWEASSAFRRLIDNEKVPAMAAQLSGARERRERAARLARPGPVQTPGAGRPPLLAPGLARVADAAAEDRADHRLDRAR